MGTTDDAFARNLVRAQQQVAASAERSARTKEMIGRSLALVFRDAVCPERMHATVDIMRRMAA